MYEDERTSFINIYTIFLQIKILINFYLRPKQYIKIKKKKVKKRHLMEKLFLKRLTTF